MRDEARRFDRRREDVRAGDDGGRARPVRPHLRLYHAAIALVDGAQPRDRAALDPRVAHVELVPCRARRCGCFAHLPVRAWATACAIVPASVTENVVATTPGRLTITTAGAGRTPVFATSPETARSF